MKKTSNGSKKPCNPPAKGSGKDFAKQINKMMLVLPMKSKKKK